MSSEAAVREAIRNQALYCEASGSPVTARVLRALEAVLDRSSETGRRILDWRGDPRGSGDSVPLRIAGGLHALARAGDPALAPVYAGSEQDPERIAALISGALAAHDAALARWLDSPPQTNEVGRSAALMAGMLVLADRHRLPFEIFELGASAGLNLNLDRFAYRLGDTAAGDPASPVRLAPRWEGPSPPAADVRIVARRAVDRAPVDIADPAQRARLAAYVWPGQDERMALLASALAVADAYPPLVETSDAGDFVNEIMAMDQPDCRVRLFLHSIFWTYVSVTTQQAITARLAASSTTDRRPLAWLRYELDGTGGVAELLLSTWPGGVTERLAVGHPHVTSLRWLGEKRR